VWVTAGAVFDAIVDLRARSRTYGHWFGCRLDARNFRRIYIPRGFAHGYMTLEPGTEFQYKVDAFYAPEADSGICWNDPDIGVAWPACAAGPLLSAKDRRLPAWKDFRTPFI
jgi:dTDP-4-dehydrorhamnose 3,5-epimerase